MSRQVEANQDEALDALVWRATGQGSPALEAVLAANPGLARGGRGLAAGTLVTIPDAAVTPAAAPLIQLWD